MVTFVAIWLGLTLVVGLVLGQAIRRAGHVPAAVRLDSPELDGPRLDASTPAVPAAGGTVALPAAPAVAVPPAREPEDGRTGVSGDDSTTIETAATS
ncbi:hypothetical protein [Blastococcus sp. SYSU DS0617]